MTTLENIVETDVLVIGGGVAGCFAAIKAREQGLDVTIVDKAYAGKSGASIAAPMGWIVFNPEWGLDFDTCLNAITVWGEYINHREWSEVILRDSLATYEDLVTWGVEFPLDALKRIHEWPPFGTLPLKRREHAPALRKQAEKVGARIMDRIMITHLLKQDEKVVGAIGFPADSYDLYIFKAKATILSAGNNSFRASEFHISCMTGDAEAMAYRVGAEITGKEFPTTHPNMSPPTYSAKPPASPVQHNHREREREKGPPSFTDAEGNKVKWGIAGEPDLSLEFIVHAGKGPLTSGDNVPLAGGGAAAGYANVQAAGIWVINTKCATSLLGLYAAGDCCGTRQVGAYHSSPGFGLAGAAVTGKRAGAGAADYALRAGEPVIDEEELARLKKIVYMPAERKGGFSPRWVAQLLQNTMMPYFVLHIKHGERLQAALTIVEFLRDHLVPRLVAKDPHELRLAHETKNMVLNAEMILRATLFRTESRGMYYRV